MKSNMGKADKLLRLLLSIVLLTLYLTNVISGTWAIVALVVAVIFSVTSFINFCPLYALIGLKTNHGNSIEK
ncbi:MAG: DUF2892 domain-containing protein [Flavobacteriaceae bacterium]|nr:DUF2892 domain-containing protein [Flavobacteriaceae bacterium]